MESAVWQGVGRCQRRIPQYGEDVVAAAFTRTAFPSPSPSLLLVTRNGGATHVAARARVGASLRERTHERGKRWGDADSRCPARMGHGGAATGAGARQCYTRREEGSTPTSAESCCPERRRVRGGKSTVSLKTTFYTPAPSTHNPPRPPPRYWVAYSTQSQTACRFTQPAPFYPLPAVYTRAQACDVQEVSVTLPHSHALCQTRSLKGAIYVKKRKTSKRSHKAGHTSALHLHNDGTKETTQSRGSARRLRARVPLRRLRRYGGHTRAPLAVVASASVREVEGAERPSRRSPSRIRGKKGKGRSCRSGATPAPRSGTRQLES